MASRTLTRSSYSLAKRPSNKNQWQQLFTLTLSSSSRTSSTSSSQSPSRGKMLEPSSTTCSFFSHFSLSLESLALESLSSTLDFLAVGSVPYNLACCFTLYPDWCVLPSHRLQKQRWRDFEDISSQPLNKPSSMSSIYVVTSPYVFCADYVRDKFKIGCLTTYSKCAWSLIEVADTMIRLLTDSLTPSSPWWLMGNCRITWRPGRSWRFFWNSSCSKSELSSWAILFGNCLFGSLWNDLEVSF